jgi:hypothetical protein
VAPRIRTGSTEQALNTRASTGIASAVAAAMRRQP